MGIIAGRRALKDIRWTGEGGRDKALLAIRINAAVTVVVVASLVVASLPSSSDDVAVTDLKAHQCYVLTSRHEVDPHSGVTTLDKVRRVGCDRRHDGEVVGLWDADAAWTSYPDDKDVVTARSSLECSRLVHAYAMDIWRLPDDSTEHYFAPTENGWRLSGIHHVVCSLESDDGKREGSLYQDPAALQPDQKAYLAAEDDMDIVQSQLPDNPTADGDMDEWTAYAKDMATAERKLEQALKAHNWPSAAVGPVTGVETVAHRAAAAWAKAGADTDASTMDVDVKAAKKIGAGTPYGEVRDSLHLTGVDPEPTQRV